MPTPLGHAVAGVVVHAIVHRRDPQGLASRGRLALAVGAATAPDLDLLAKLVDGVNHHQTVTHSLGAAALAALAVLAVALARRVPRAGALARAAGIAWSSHVLLDWLAVDTSPPIGIMALWPASHGFYHCPVSLFLAIARNLTPATVLHDLLALAWEMLVLGPLAWAAWPRPGTTG
jgi:inner membrane protein